MKQLKSRLEKLESVIKISEKDPYANRPYTWEKDWTCEEIHLLASCLRRNEEPPPELIEKVKLTKPSGRLAGMSKEEIAALANELMDPDDDLADDLVALYKPEVG